MEIDRCSLFTLHWLLAGLGKTLANALQLHPTAAVIWVKGAQWEFEQNGNAPGAR
jgi:hypothetical protein